jgi:hypothetical protein
LKYLSIIILLSFHNVSGQEILEHQLDSEMNNKGQVKFALQHSLILKDLEDEFLNNAVPYEFNYQQTAIGVSHGVSNDQVIRLGLTLNSSFRRIDSKMVVGDPVISFWRRISEDREDSEFSNDIGVEWTLGFLSDEKLRPSSGHRIGLNYRFSLGDDESHAMAKYSIGFQEGLDIDSINIPSSYFHGAQLVYEHRLIGKIDLGVGLKILRNSVNQSLIFYQERESSPSWETSTTVYLSYALSRNTLIRINYTAENETGGFYRSKNPGDIDRESKIIGLSLAIH